VAGATSNAPADADAPAVCPELRGFAPMPQRLLPFPSIVVASSDDPWIAPQRARSLAAFWGSHFVDAGPQGHLNAASGIGAWTEGQALLERVIDASSDGRGHARTAGEARAVLVRPRADERGMRACV
jgi:predicted alpha/beta hydrolase family esterase